ncbi:hypothetical protein SAMD00019534_103430, partial [Acytostelium subglobosum LB1]|uniref:hypothetical protein n=1 Tax=Acytostelium subglobosum LB1 TaxID=1410327 RepID=UPI000644ACD3
MKSSKNLILISSILLVVLLYIFFSRNNTVSGLENWDNTLDDKRSILSMDQSINQQQQQHNKTFVVNDDVELSSIDFLDSLNYSRLIGNQDEEKQWHWRYDPPQPKVIRSSIQYQDESIVWLSGNSLIRSIMIAYANHMHLVIRPDDIWQAIITQFSFYVNARSDTLRDKFVSFNGKRELTIFSKGTLFTANFDDIITMISDQISNIKDPSIRDWIIPNFTTTTDTDRVVGGITMMATTKNYFDYKVVFLCGLPQVTLLGSVDDWTEIRDRDKRLVEFDTEDKYLEQWVEMLLPVLDNFIMTAEGTPDIDWWKSIVNKQKGLGCNTEFLTGWITTFIPFSEMGEWQAELRSVETMGDTRENPVIHYDSQWPIILIDNVPRGFVSCPLKINDNGNEFDTEIYGGHITSKLINDNTTIIPQIDWC